MKRERAIAGTPVRSGFDSWTALVDVIVASLESSSNIQAGSVAPELAHLDGLGPALAGGGYLESDPVALVADPLHVSFTIPTGAAAFEVADSESVIPGSGTAAAAWCLYLPKVATFAGALDEAVKGSAHLKVGPAPETKDEAVKSAAALDLDALRNLGGTS
jgi:hypothetical protein